MVATQSNRHVRVSTPLGTDVLLLRQMEMQESLGRLFEVKLELLSELHDISFEDVIGENMVVTLDVQGGEERYVHGCCTEFSQTGQPGRFATYHAVLRPWLWFLTRTADCRIFQEKTVPDIIKEVFREHGFSDFEESLQATYRTWEYCVQYRESDFNFVSRLMEQEGIYYFFRHEEGKHVLVLADSSSAHSAVSPSAEVPYYPPSENVWREEGVITDVRIDKRVQTGAYVLDSFDFKKPKASLITNASASRAHGHSEYEVFDYPGEYLEKADGKLYVNARLEEQQAEFERISGTGDPRQFYCGGLFNLVNFPRDDQNREYLLIAVSQTAHGDYYESRTTAEELDDYRCTFVAIDSREPFRTPRSTPKPGVRGPQTAVVVGPQGEEIHTDEYGRVKVQFHWDRYGKSDEKSSCWVRVSQVWAGKQWGAMYIPRVGQEVIVDFLEGDPDKPIVTGRVYNADNMPPYSLPENKTQSGIKSRSTKEGTPENFNEIRFEDKKGEEDLYIHAEKDQTIVVENDKSEAIGNNNSEEVVNDETITVGHDRKKEVGADQEEVIGGNKSIEVGKNHDEKVGANIKVISGESTFLEAGDDFKITGGRKGVIDIEDQLTIKCGKAVIQMKKNGDILIKGKKISVEGSGNIVMKASQILQN